MTADRSRYLGLFVTDTREQLQGLERELLLAAQASASRSAFDAAFRHLHTIKSSAATMGFSNMASVAHLAESLTAAQPRDVEAPAHIIDLLLRTVDALGEMTTLAESGAQPTVDLSLVRALESHAPAPSPAPPTPPAQSTPALTLPEGAHTRIVIRVAPDTPAPAARAFLALRKIESTARVLATEPDAATLRTGHLPDRTLIVVLEGDVPLDALRALVGRLPGIAGVDAAALTPLPVAQPSSPRAHAEPASDAFVRVKAEFLDHLLELAGEMLLSTARLQELVQRGGESEGLALLTEEAHRLRLRVRAFNNEVLLARQTPVTLLTERLPRLVRDLATRLDKPLSVSVEGADTTADRGLLEALVSPLLHVVRNAADHGIESPDERLRAGKPETGHLTFRARRERDRVVIELSDDGRGFDPERLREKAVRAGILSSEQARALDPQASLRLAFLSGLSTRDELNELSGRGVGLDAVLRAVEQQGGQVELRSTMGAGATVRFSLPVTTSLTQVLLVAVGDEVLALPTGRVLFAFAGPGEVPRSVPFGGDFVPSYSLGRILGLDESSSHRTERPYVVVDAEGHRAALAVDGLPGQEEIVLHPLVAPLERVSGLAGTAILGSGRAVFVLDIPRLLV